MELFNVLSELEELIEDSFKVPLSHKILIDEERILDFLDRIRAVMPEEIRQARWVLQERDTILAESKEEAQAIVEKSKIQISKQTEESEVVRQAQEMAEQIIRRSEALSREIKEGAHGYADDILANLEEKLSDIIEQIRQGRGELQGVKKDNLTPSD